MPVRIRLATKGASRKLNVSISSSFHLCEGGRNQIEIVIEQLEIVRDFLDAADRWQQHQNRAAGGLRNGVRSAQIEIRLYQNQLDVFALHRIDNLQRMARRRRYARLWFNVIDDYQPEALAEIGPGPVLGDHFAAAIRRHRRVPALLGFAQALVEIGEALGEIGCIGWPELGELVLKSFSDAPSVLRVKPIVRIAQGMHIAHRALDLCRGDLENLAELRHVDIAPASHLDLGISTLRDQGRQPSDLELQAHHHQQIRFLELQQEAGLRLDEKGSLIALWHG